MKKLLSAILALSLVLAALPLFTIKAGATGETVTTGDFTFRVLDDNTLEAVSYNGDSKEVVIYSSVNGRPVTSIADGAFRNNFNLERVVLPLSIKHIGAQAFMYCVNLKELNINSNTLETIGDFAFANCPKIFYFKLSENVTSIGSYAIGVTITENPQTGGLTAIYETSTIIIAPKGSVAEQYGTEHRMRVYDNVEDFIDVAITVHEDGTAELIKYYGTSADPLICDYYNGNLLTTISSGAFLENEQLEHIRIPYNVTTIGALCFANCPNLSQVELPEKLEAVGDYAFLNCPKVKELELPYSVNTIGENAFGFESVVTETNQLDYVHVADFSLKGYKYTLAEEYANLNDVRFSPLFYTHGDFQYSNYYGDAIIIEKYNGKSDEVYVPSSLYGIPVSIIENGAFQGNEWIESVWLPESVVIIESQAFSGCTNLRSVTMDGVILIESQAFVDCQSLEEISLPNVNTINDFAFYGCSSLSEVTLSNQLKIIGNFAFYDCPSLNNLLLPISVWDIGYYAMGCYGDHYETYPYFSMTVYEHTIGKDYARAFDFPYQLMGDVNGDSRAGINDITMMQRILAGISYGKSGYNRSLADVNQDGKFDINDVTMLQKILAYMYET